MSQTLGEIAEELRKSDKKVQLIYAFNGSGKTRLSREFRNLIAPKDVGDGDGDGDGDGYSQRSKILYYNAFTEDLFYWDNDLQDNLAPKLVIQPNRFTRWALIDQGQDKNVIGNFQRYTNNKLTPGFNEDYSEVTFSLRRGNAEPEEHIKISKGEESNFIWSIFEAIIGDVVQTLNFVEPEDRPTDQFNELEYIFIDDPVSSLDENHLIELAATIANIIRKSESALKFIITTHNPLFYNVLHNEFGNARRYLLGKEEDGSHTLTVQPNDSPFSYHLLLKKELEIAVSSRQMQKYHYNFLRNVLEKTATYLGYDSWKALLPEDGSAGLYEARMINLFSHSKHSGDEASELNDDDKRVLGYLVSRLNGPYHFKSDASSDASAGGAS